MGRIGGAGGGPVDGRRDGPAGGAGGGSVDGRRDGALDGRRDGAADGTGDGALDGRRDGAADGLRDGGLDRTPDLVSDARRDTRATAPPTSRVARSKSVATESTMTAMALPTASTRPARTCRTCINHKKEICNNGIDDDGNGLIDCQDPACFGDPACFVPGHEICNNGWMMTTTAWWTARIRTASRIRRAS